MDTSEKLPSGYRETRPWGEFIVLEDQAGHKVKRLIVHPGKRISYQRHTKRTEHWVVIQGVAEITLDDVQTLHNPGDTILVLQGQKHRLANPAQEPLIVIEVQRGTYFGEDDIERFDDDYGRK